MEQGRTRVTPLQEGASLVIKRMEGSGGVSFPGHRASLESALVVVEGQCIFRTSDSDQVLKQGDSVVVPADIWHQVVAKPDFNAIHIMPAAIRFDFSK